MWDVESGQLLTVAKPRAQELYSVDWSPDGKMIASSGLNASVTVWDAANLKVLHEIESPEWVIRVCFNPQGTRLFYAGGSQFAGGERYVEMLGVL
jgi:WD40 repeat protein